MPDERVLSIAERLLALSAGGKQRWQAVAPPEDADPEWRAAEYGTRLEQGSVVIGSRTPEGRYPYRLELYDPSGELLGRLETGSDADTWLGDGQADDWELTLRDLYDAARGSAVDADSTLDGMLKELKRRGK